MDQLTITVLLGVLTAVPSIWAVINARKKDREFSEDAFVAQLQADNKELREETRRLRAERDATEAKARAEREEMEQKIDELEAKLKEAATILHGVQLELEKYKKGNINGQ